MRSRTRRPARRALLLARLLALVLVVGSVGCGAEGEGANPAATTAVDQGPVDQTVEVKMLDVKFSPDTIMVKAGTTVRFRFVNDGALVHEAAFGDEAAQEALRSGKAKRDGPQLNPNQKADYVRRFTTPGELLIGCHIPGHYQSGMKARIRIE